jgi:hypothetical protein
MIYIKKTMKKITFSFLCTLFICSYCNAQSNHKSVNKNKSVIKTASSKNKSTATRIDTLSNSRNYKWKDGQTATPTGEEATGTNTERFVSGKKDSLKLKSTKKKQ